MSKPAVRRCAVYTRKSSEEGLDQDFNSLEAQREAGTAYIKSQTGEGWRLVETRYDDGGISGGTLERPALKRLVSDIEAGRVHVVVVYKVDRLTRSLADFAKLVQVFEKKGVSFVSVTQQFNTTTSMGRLMLNVLLSFAQFEREVTGERIRDKIAASKKKGMWMGGTPPIGYEAKAQRLVVVEHDAETVRSIFRRYLELGCITLLAKDLASAGIQTRRYTSASGAVFGGLGFSRGHLHRILTNRIYLGDIVHHGAVYAGEHPAIIDRELWDAVQARIEANRNGHRRSSSPEPAGLLAGKVFDDAGNPMTAMRMRRHSRQYRYYVSRAVLEQRREAAGSVSRISATALEEAVAISVRGLNGAATRAPVGRGNGPSEDDQLRLFALVGRVIVRSRLLEVAIRPESEPNFLANGGAFTTGPDDAAREEVLKVPFESQRTRGRARVVPPSGGAASQPGVNGALVKSVVRGNEWARLLLSGQARSVGELAKLSGVTPSYVSRLMRYAFLAPDIVEAILQGGPGVNLEAFGQSGALPLDWQRQRRLVGL